MKFFNSIESDLFNIAEKKTVNSNNSKMCKITDEFVEGIKRVLIIRGKLFEIRSIRIFKKKGDKNFLDCTR